MKHITAILVSSVVTALLLAGCSPLSENTVNQKPAPITTPPDNSQADTPSETEPTGDVLSRLLDYTNNSEAGENGNYYWVSGDARIDVSLMPEVGSVSFNANGQGRSGVARGSLTYKMFDESRGSRQGDPLDPPAWPNSNPKVGIPYGLTGKVYHGYFWNRSHSISDGLAGEQSYTSLYNFTSGSRPQNVGANQNGGMRAVEVYAEDYWKNNPNSSETIWYQVTPVYNDSERIPRGSIVDVLSSDGALNQEFVIINSAENFLIDYVTGEITELSTGAAVAPEVPQTEPETPVTDSQDPRFSSCAKAKEAGYGPYTKGVDVEYDWYRDGDGDGTVCE